MSSVVMDGTDAHGLVKLGKVGQTFSSFSTNTMPGKLIIKLKIIVVISDP